MQPTTLETIRVPAQPVSPQTTWPVICDGCGRHSPPRTAHTVTIARTDHILCARCWKRIAA